jgi:hypothetical protein
VHGPIPVTASLWKKPTSKIWSQCKLKMTIKDLDDKLLNVFKECPYKGKRKECTFSEMRDMEIDERLDFLDEMDEDEKVTKWQKHLECFMNALAR